MKRRKGKNKNENGHGPQSTPLGLPYIMDISHPIPFLIGKPLLVQSFAFKNVVSLEIVVTRFHIKDQ